MFYQNFCCRRRYNCCSYINRCPRFSTITPTIMPTPPTTTANIGFASFINSATTSLETNTPIPVISQFNNSNGSIVNTSGESSIIINSPGTYLISYNANASSTTSGDVGITAYLYANAIANSISSTTITEGETVSLSKEFVINVSTTPATLYLANSSDNATTFTNLNLVITELDVQ